MPKTCIICGREFEPPYYQQKTCSEACRKARAKQRRKNYPYDRFPWSEYRHAYYCRHRDKVKAQTISRRNRKYHLLCINAYLDYLAHLEATYGKLPNDRIKRMILDWRGSHD